MIITIDGPVASGKSSVARLLAQHVQAVYINSGLFYRALAYLLAQKGYTPQEMKALDGKKVKEIVDLSQLTYRYDDAQERMFYAQKDITPQLKTALIDDASSSVSVVPSIRQLVNTLIQAVAQENGVVIDGRDTGSVIFPHARYKFFLTADPEVRASRWQKDQKRLGNQYTLQEALASVNERDKRDRTRTISPLVVPEGAIMIDTGANDIQGVLAKMQEAIAVPLS